MINIVSTRVEGPVSGPQKVLANLCKGLDMIGYPYVLNQRLDATRRLWIHDDVEALSYARPEDVATVVGPNLYSMPKDVPSELTLEDVLYLHPSRQICDLWRYAGFTRAPLRSWPVGIDTRDFAPGDGEQREDFVLLYHKRRDRAEVRAIEASLGALGLRHELLEYGEYAEAEYKQLLASCRFVLWHGCHESQGIALQEALAAGVPVLVWDVTSLADDMPRGSYDEPMTTLAVTTVPYFDERCGVRVWSADDLPDAIRAMFERAEEFSPREYVEEHLSLKGQAAEFVRLWEEFGLSTEAGYSESLLRSGTLRPPVSWRVKRTGRRYSRGVLRRLRRLRRMMKPSVVGGRR